MREIKLYRFTELSEEAKKRVIEREITSRQNDSEIPWRDETFDSLKSLFEHTHGAKLLDYSLGMYEGYLKVDLGDAENLTGARALGWIENNLLSGLRMTRAKYLSKRKEYFGYGLRVGKIPECPLTGYCADEDYLEDLKKGILEGDTLKEAFQGLASTYSRLLESEYKAYTSEEYVREDLENMDTEYTKDGVTVY